VRRVARAGGDLHGEAQALSRLGALVRDPERAAALLVEAADAYERADRPDDAITALAKAVELRPGDAAAYQRVHERLRGDLAHPGRAAIFDNLLSHRLAVTPAGAPARVALLYERAQHRLQRLGDRIGAFQDLKQILSIAPEHREALQQLAAGALEDRDSAEAVQWLERFLAVASDDPRAGAARLDLAAAYESVKDRARAVETLRRAAAAQPTDATPLARLADLQLRAGDWRGAIEALRAAEPRVHEARARAALHLRIGSVLRDLGRDPAGAAASFRRAAEIDPVGDGTRALVALQDAAGDPTGGLETVERELALVRRALATDPLDAELLERLREFLGAARARGLGAPVAEAEAAVGSVLRLLATGWTPIAPGAVPPFKPQAGRALFDELLDPGAAGFLAELWPNLIEAAEALFPAAGGRDRRAAVTRGDDRFGWIQPIANGLGLPEIDLFVSRDARPELVAAIPEPALGLVFAPGAEDDPALRFAVGRMLGLHAQHASLLERVSAEKLAPLFACAAVLAGAPPPGGFPAPAEDLVRTVTRTVSRKHRKALALQASRFGFESFDLAAWHRGVLRTADRLGLLVAGDVATAAVSLAGAARGTAGSTTGDSSGSAATPAARVAQSRAALELVRFALGDRYPTLRRAASGEALAAGTLPGERRS
jgi:tetratricopeptide (TPR) repeat protein